MIDSIYNEGGGTPIEFDPKKLKYNSDGIPVLSAREIEAVANELLQKYCPDVLHKPSMTPVAEIIKRLGERTGLLFAIEDLGHKGTAKVLGKASFHKKTLYLDTSLDNELKAAFRFTAAHEIGHWVLHRYNYKNWKFQPHNETSGGLQDDDSTLCRLENRTQSDWLEFQANVFAASLVTPREMFIVALKQIQKTIGIDKNIGRIYLSNAQYSRRDYETTVSQLAQVFHVSKKSVRVRTRTLRLIEGEDRNENKTCRINPFTVLTSLQN
jgi:Zn-dependent peptidase ImmA (M78 family)